MAKKLTIYFTSGLSRTYEVTNEQYRLIFAALENRKVPQQEFTITMPKVPISFLNTHWVTHMETEEI